tara:strand:+ start:2551 stop:3813 length:1263 start_codon:yes stop_codon:yes gene_type:complete
LIYQKRKTCAICGNKERNTILDYGDVPAAGSFPKTNELNKEPKYHLGLEFCDVCGLLQTNSILDADYLFKDYRYMSSIGLSQHYSDLASLLVERFSLDGASSVVEIGSNDGVLQVPFQKLGVSVVGVEPAQNIAQIAKSKGVQVINDYFNLETSLRYFEANCVDIVIANNCFAHIHDIHAVIKGIQHIMKESGTFIMEVHYVKALIEELQYDNIYHEHLYYYSLHSLENLFKQYGMTIVDCCEIAVHSGSIRVYVQNQKCTATHRRQPRTPRLMSLLGAERAVNIKNVLFYKNFASSVKKHCNLIREGLQDIKRSGARIVGYGASGRGNMACSIWNLNSDIIDYIVDESPERVGRYTASTNIPIVSKETLDNDNPDHVLVFAWNFINMIADKLKDREFKLLCAFPTFGAYNPEKTKSNTL